MDTFKLLKLKNYFSHLVLGTFVLLTGTGIIQSIVLEMIQEYDPASKTAYICGLIACGVIALYGIYEILRAFYFEKHIFKNLEPEEEEEFLDELCGHVLFSLPGKAVMTENYLLLPVKGSLGARVFSNNQIVGCFQTTTHKEENASEGAMVLFDTDFKSCDINLSGKGSGQAMARLYEKICSSLPWIFHEDYESFLVQMRKIGHRKKILKQLKDRRMRCETAYDSDVEAEKELEAVTEDVKEKLNPESFLKNFLSKKSK